MWGKTLAQLLLVATGIWMITVGATGWLYFEQDEEEPEERKVSEERVWVVENTVPLGISIPSIDVDLDVLPGSVKNDQWEVSEEKANYLIGTGLVGRPGNIVVYGHKRPHIFGKLSQLEIGDNIVVRSRDAVGVYKIIKAYETTEDDTTVLSDALVPEITVYTCNRWNDSHRYVVKGRLVQKYANGLGGIVARELASAE